MGQRLAAAVVLLAVPFLIAAGPGLEYTPPTAPAAPDVAGLIFRLFGLTAAMIALCGGVVWLVRRVKQPAAAKGDPARLRHEGSLPLDRRCAPGQRRRPHRCRHHRRDRVAVAGSTVRAVRASAGRRDR
jgi:hypothetical protein